MKYKLIVTHNNIRVIHVIFSPFMFLFLIPFLFSQQQQDLEVYYNAAIEKYIKNDYQKAVEYMEKVYSLSPQQKYKNFIIKILAEAANDAYMKHKYKEAYEYTSKALKYTTENEQINQLHKILTDILGKPQQKLQQTELPVQPTKPSPKQQPEMQEVVSSVKEQKVKPYNKTVTTTTVTQVIYVKDKKFQILFYLSVILLAIMSTVWIFSQIKLNLKIKKQMSAQILQLQKENSDLKLKLTEVKTELEKTKERELLYKKYLEDYKKDAEEKIKIITQLQQNLVSKEKISTFVTQKPTIISDHVLTQQHKEILNLISNPPKNVIESEYQLELYREKIAVMLKTLYEVNPQKAAEVIQQMLNNDNPFVRMNIPKILAEIATEETVKLLLEMFNDKDLRVKREALKQLLELKTKIETQQISLPEEIKQKIIQIIQQEKSKGEWLF